MAKDEVSRSAALSHNQAAMALIDTMFKDNPDFLVRHHLDSFNAYFTGGGMSKMLRENNPIKIVKEPHPTTGEFGLRCDLYPGGKSGDKLYFGKPTIYDGESERFMYPNDARLRNMTYAATIQCDVEVEFFASPDGQKLDEPSSTHTLEKVLLGRFPIMLHSDLCILRDMPATTRFEMGECRNDPGGYFVIDGKEKCIIPQEKFADNAIYVTNKGDDKYSCAANIRSVPDDVSISGRRLSVRMVAASETATASRPNGQVVVLVPNVRLPIPLFILMRALGVVADKDIIDMCLLEHRDDGALQEMLRPSVHDGGKLFTQPLALRYIATLTKGKTLAHALDSTTRFLLPHVGRDNYRDKAFFLGHMVSMLLRTQRGDIAPTDRDSFRFKRVEVPGVLLSQLFKEHYSLQQKDLFKAFDAEYYFKQGVYKANFESLVSSNYQAFFAKRLLETGVRKAFKGNWVGQGGAQLTGIVQDLNRLSFNSAIGQLRKLNLPLDASAKVLGPRFLHGSQWGIIDPVDTPDGGNVGLHKHLAIATRISPGTRPNDIIEWLESAAELQPLRECTVEDASLRCKVFVNGAWVGVIPDGRASKMALKVQKAEGMLPHDASISWDPSRDTLWVYTDPGRLCRPVFRVKDSVPAYDDPTISRAISSQRATWNAFVYGDKGRPCSVEFIDTAEEENVLIALSEDQLGSGRHAYLEVHGSLTLGVMGNQVVYPENNQLPRDLFACGQMKQAVSLYHSNYQVRIDKTGVVLNCGMLPLVRSRYLRYVSKEEHPYGENAIVAIMCYGGYNVEDAVLFNKGSMERGLFRTTYYNSYESLEESSTVAGSQSDTRFANIENTNVVGLRPGYDYSQLDEAGLVREGTRVDDKTILIGRVITNLSDPETSIDASVAAKKGQTGYVDRAFITDGEEGFRIAKVRIRSERRPAVGDKFCSRCGQKGTIGRLIPEADMPFTADGVRPDIIVNPHALPSRMTIGQLVEALTAKACVFAGGIGDCTAFMNKGPKAAVFGEILRQHGFNGNANEVLFNADSGKPMDAEIFIGPTYYMRLKHMVKDKINYRARGPRTLLTRQTVQGRANDGGLRLGEMERDGVIGHGAAQFLNESLMVRGDDYHMAICNNSGMLAIYNATRDVFLSPISDGPLRFNEMPDGDVALENKQRHGSTFSIVRAPYSFKLLMQELQVMGVQMHLITDANIDKLASLSRGGVVPTSVVEGSVGELEKLSVTHESPDTAAQEVDDAADDVEDEIEMDGSLAPLEILGTPAPQEIMGEPEVATAPSEADGPSVRTVTMPSDAATVAAPEEKRTITLPVPEGPN